jgi:hypothetical protein
MYRNPSPSKRHNRQIGKKGTFARSYPLSRHCVGGIGDSLERNCPFSRLSFFLSDLTARYGPSSKCLRKSATSARVATQCEESTPYTLRIALHSMWIGRVSAAYERVTSRC